MNPIPLHPQLFNAAQILLLMIVVWAVLRFLKSQQPTPGLKSEPKRKPKPTSHSKPRQQTRALLQGVVLTGLPHQILGVREDAGEFEVRRAHRALIKRFHPDKVGREGSREWYEAQRASEVINGAREAMLKKLRS